jgi:hypothetical protein
MLKVCSDFRWQYALTPKAKHGITPSTHRVRHGLLTPPSSPIASAGPAPKLHLDPVAFSLATRTRSSRCKQYSALTLLTEVVVLYNALVSAFIQEMDLHTDSPLHFLDINKHIAPRGIVKPEFKPPNTTTLSLLWEHTICFWLGALLSSSSSRSNMNMRAVELAKIGIRGLFDELVDLEQSACARNLSLRVNTSFTEAQEYYSTYSRRQRGLPSSSP